MDVDVERSREQAARRRVHRIIESIKQLDPCHDEHDLIEEGVAGVLQRYGLCVALTPLELSVLKQQLAELGWEVQAREIARIVEAEPH